MGEKYPLTKEEIETDITLDYMDKCAHIYTCHAATKKKLLAMAERDPDVVVEKATDVGLFVHVPIKYVAIRPPRKHALSEEALQALSERMAAINAQRKQGELSA